MASVFEEMPLLNSEAQAVECLSDEELGRQTQTVEEARRGRGCRVIAGASSSLALLCVVAGVRSLSGGVGVRSLNEDSHSGGVGVLSLNEDVLERKPCLCVFDVDRTLTGKQGWADRCAAAREQEGVIDKAYGRGTLLFSQLALKIDATACRYCFRGVVTAGTAGGPNSAEQAKILEALGGTERTRSDFWQSVHHDLANEVKSSLVTVAVDGRKHHTVLSMLEWWKKDQHIDIKNNNVFFFDDTKENVEPFNGTGINARQVSCEVRGPQEKHFGGQYPGKLGGCGGTPAEVVGQKGIKFC